jgi:hypothetical protein
LHANKTISYFKGNRANDTTAKEFVGIIDTSHKEGLATKEDIKDLEILLIKWVIGLMIAQTSITIALLKLF